MSLRIRLLGLSRVFQAAGLHQQTLETQERPRSPNPKRPNDSDLDRIWWSYDRSRKYSSGSGRSDFSSHCACRWIFDSTPGRSSARSISLIAHAFLLRAGHDKISEIMKDTPIMSEDQTRVALRDWNFRMENEEHFLITSELLKEASSPEFKGLKIEQAWRPPILHPMFKLSLALIIVGTILSLEFALRHSTSHHGFGSLDGQDWWTYVASGYLFFLGIFLSSYAFSIRHWSHSHHAPILSTRPEIPRYSLPIEPRFSLPYTP
ncbi:hypothetical protein B0H13DRAFT_1930343 [Mycena leptocephala]|nr:hypothetical protein B0H13DRAFT_1930343 [Mycena leptocephala]